MAALAHSTPSHGPSSVHPSPVSSSLPSTGSDTQTARPLRRTTSRLLRPLSLPQYDSKLKRSIGFGLAALDLPQAPEAPREHHKTTRFNLIADPALLLQRITSWGPVALTTYTALGRMTSIVEITRTEYVGERIVLRAGGTHSLQLSRRAFQHCVAGTPNARRGEGDWSFTINWTDANGQPLLDLAILNPTRIDPVTECLRPFLLKSARASTRPSPHPLRSVNRPGMTTAVNGPFDVLPLEAIKGVLAVRHSADALNLDLHSDAVRHRYVGPVLFQRAAGAELNATGDGCSTQLLLNGVDAFGLHPAADGIWGARIRSSNPSEFLQVSPASGDEFAAWWLSRLRTGQRNH
jgi:hypothetical protein